MLVIFTTILIPTVSRADVVSATSTSAVITEATSTDTETSTSTSPIVLPTSTTTDTTATPTIEVSTSMSPTEPTETETSTTTSPIVLPTSTTTDTTATPTPEVSTDTELVTPTATTTENTEPIVSVSTTTLPGTTIHLKVETGDAELYNKDIEVHPCADSQTGTTTSINALCAVEQAGVELGWTLAKTWYSFGVSLDGINQYVADYVNNKYWLWFNTTPASIEPGATGLESHTLATNETLLLTYNTSPLELMVGTSSPTVGATTTLSSFFFDTNLWSVGTTSNIVLNVNGIDVATSTDGVFNFTPETTTPYRIFVHKAGLVSSDPITLVATDAEVPPTIPEVVTSGGGGESITHNKINESQAISFLNTNQHLDGSYGADLYSDWVAMAFASYSGANPAKISLTSYLINHKPADGSPLTDYERRAMALESLDINPYNGAGFNYISKITESFDGTQFGDKDLFNDDVFALIPLLHAGYSSSDQIVKTDVSFVLSKQQGNGAWDGVDLTAATLQALSMVSDLPGVTNAISQGKGYLKSKQQNDGGFANSPATSWTLLALSALTPKEDIENGWLVNNKNPQDYLASLQQADGGIELTSVDSDSRVWATAYAIPAGLGAPWTVGLKSFAKPEMVIVGGGGGSFIAPLEISTSSVAIATSSTPLATTTLAITTLSGSSTEDQIVPTIPATTSPKIIKHIIKKVTKPQIKQVITTLPSIKAPEVPTAPKIVIEQKGFLALLGLSVRDFVGTFYLGLGSTFGFR